MKKTAQINIMIEPQTKQRLSDKAKALGLTLTSYFEKVANEPVCFMDSNAKMILESLKLKI